MFLFKPADKTSHARKFARPWTPIQHRLTGSTMTRSAGGSRCVLAAQKVSMWEDTEVDLTTEGVQLRNRRQCRLTNTPLTVMWVSKWISRLARKPQKMDHALVNMKKVNRKRPWREPSPFHQVWQTPFNAGRSLVPSGRWTGSLRKRYRWQPRTAERQSGEM